MKKIARIFHFYWNIENIFLNLFSEVDFSFFTEPSVEKSKNKPLSYDFQTFVPCTEPTVDNAKINFNYLLIMNRWLEYF